MDGWRSLPWLQKWVACWPRPMAPRLGHLLPHQAALPGPTDVLELNSALKCLTRWEPPNIWLFPSVKWGYDSWLTEAERTWVLDGEYLSPHTSRRGWGPGSPARLCSPHSASHQEEHPLLRKQAGPHKSCMMGGSLAAGI